MCTILCVALLHLFLWTQPGVVEGFCFQPCSPPLTSIHMNERESICTASPSPLVSVFLLELSETLLLLAFLHFPYSSLYLAYLLPSVSSCTALLHVLQAASYLYIWALLTWSLFAKLYFSHFPGCSCIIPEIKRGKILTYTIMFVWEMERVCFLGFFFQSKYIKMAWYYEVVQRLCSLCHIPWAWHLKCSFVLLQPHSLYIWTLVTLVLNYSELSK